MQSSPTSTLECLGSITRKQRWTIAMNGPPTHPEQKPFCVQSRITMLCPLISPALQVLQHAGRERNHLSWAITSSSKPDIAFGTRLPLHPPYSATQGTELGSHFYIITAAWHNRRLWHPLRGRRASIMQPESSGKPLSVFLLSQKL